MTRIATGVSERQVWWCLGGVEEPCRWPSVADDRPRSTEPGMRSSEAQLRWQVPNSRRQHGMRQVDGSSLQQRSGYWNSHSRRSGLGINRARARWCVCVCVRVRWCVCVCVRVRARRHHKRKRPIEPGGEKILRGGGLFPSAPPVQTCYKFVFALALHAVCVSHLMVRFGYAAACFVIWNYGSCTERHPFVSSPNFICFLGLPMVSLGGYRPPTNKERNHFIIASTSDGWSSQRRQ